MSEWQPMETAPKGGYPTAQVMGKLKDGTIIESMHFARDLSGEDQPPFEGWFEYVYAGVCVGVEPIAWMPKQKGGAV